MQYIPLTCLECDSEEFAYGNLDYANKVCHKCGGTLIPVPNDYVISYIKPSQQTKNKTLED